MKRLIVYVVAAIVLAAAGFAGGMYFQRSQAAVPGAMGARGAGGAGGPMANLTDEERTQLESMTDEERQQFFQEKMGSAGPGAPGGPARGGNLEGEVVEVAADTVTLKLSSGTQTVYTDENTVVARQDGAGELAAGAKVLVFSQPSADGVNTASCIVVVK